MISEFTVVAFDTSPEGIRFSRAFCEIYEGQYAICPLKTTCSSISSDIFVHDPATTKFNVAASEFPANDEEDAATGGTLTFRGRSNKTSTRGTTAAASESGADDAGDDGDADDDGFVVDVYSYSWSQHKLNGLSLVIISAPQSIVDKWVRYRSNDVHVVPGTHAHRIWMERVSALNRFVALKHQEQLQQQESNKEEAEVEKVEKKDKNATTTLTIKLNNLFPLVVSDNVRRLGNLLKSSSSSNNNSNSNSAPSTPSTATATLSGDQQQQQQQSYFIGDSKNHKNSQHMIDIMNRLEFEITITSSSSSSSPSSGRVNVGDVVVGLVEPPPSSSSSSSFILRTNNNCANRNVSCEFLRGAISLAPIGVRDSGTHCNSSAIDPKQGLKTKFGMNMSWLATDSGLVGVSGSSSNNNSSDAAEDNKEKGVIKQEKSMSFTLFGRVLNPLRPSSSLAIRDLALSPRSLLLRTPIIAVSGTSAETGKTTLSCKLIHHLTNKNNLRVGALKVTGTGGTEDSSNHRAAGAAFTADQVDSGMPTTYQVNGEDFKKHITTSFLAAEDANVDVLVVELGGDIIYANNAELLKLDTFVNNLVGLLLIANDALAAYGGARWLSERYPLVAPKARIVNSPFRNYEGAKKRFSFLGLAEPFDVNDIEKIVGLFRSSLPSKK